MDLITAEKFLLVAQHPLKGRFTVSDTEISYGIIGAFLLDMSLDNRIGIEDKRLILKNNKRADNQVISEIITIISSSGKQRKIKFWIDKLARRSNIYRRTVQDGLERKGLIHIEHHKFLGLIPYRKCYLADSKMRDSLIRQLRECILFRKELNNENTVLLGLIEACRMYKTLSSDREELKTIRKELKAIIKESPIAETVGETIKQVQIAIISSVAAATIAASAANN